MTPHRQLRTALRQWPTSLKFKIVAMAVVTAVLSASVSAQLAGLVAAALSGLLAWWMTRPISALRRRAEELLNESGPSPADWPQGRNANWPAGQDEIGDLSRAIQQVDAKHQRQRIETQALVHRLEAVLDHAEVGIVLSRNSRLELVSQHFCDIFQCERQEALGQPTRSMYPSDQAYEALSEKARPAFTSLGVYDVELQLARRTGECFWAKMRGRAVVAGDPSQGTIWIIEDVTKAREYREQLAWSAHHDSLTGLANRAAFEELLARETALSGQAPFCALFIDLDKFKQVNDSGGHAAGDALLREVAQQLVAVVRRSDTVARLGGDEFAVMLSGCPLPRAQSLAEKLRATVANYRLEWQGVSHSVGASIGLVHVHGNYATPAAVLKAADEACYAAKRSGRDRVEVAAAC